MGRADSGEHRLTTERSGEPCFAASSCVLSCSRQPRRLTTAGSTPTSSGRRILQHKSILGVKPLAGRDASLSTWNAFHACASGVLLACGFSSKPLGRNLRATHIVGIVRYNQLRATVAGNWVLQNPCAAAVRAPVDWYSAPQTFDGSASQAVCSIAQSASANACLGTHFSHGTALAR
jgi:hypothetical protein